MTRHTFNMTEEHAEMIHQLVKDHNFALKNWIAGAVERGDLKYAQELVCKLRQHEKLYAAFNMTAKHDIAKYSDKPLRTDHIV